MGDFLRRFITALSFLTILPVPGTAHGSEADLSHAPFYFPLVGMVIALLLLVIYFFVSLFLPFTVSVVITVLSMSWISGGLHMDGLADTADGFLSGKKRADILRIMKDSAVGSFGSLAIVSVLAVKVSALLSIQEWNIASAVFIAALGGRCAMLTLISVGDYIQRDGVNLGSVFLKNRSGWNAGWALAWMVVSSLIFTGSVMLILVIYLMTTALFYFYCLKKIGGVTGDNYGALCEITEAILLIAMSALS